MAYIRMYTYIDYKRWFYVQISFFFRKRFHCNTIFLCLIFARVSDVYIDSIYTHENVTFLWYCAVQYRLHQYRRSMVLLRRNYCKISYTIKFYYRHGDKNGKRHICYEYALFSMQESCLPCIITMSSPSGHNRFASAIDFIEIAMCAECVVTATIRKMMIIYLECAGSV